MSRWCQWSPSTDRRGSKVVWVCQARNVCACFFVSACYRIFLHCSRCPCNYYATNSQFKKKSECSGWNLHVCNFRELSCRETLKCCRLDQQITYFTAAVKMWKKFKYTKLEFPPNYMQQMCGSKHFNLYDTAKEPEILERLKHWILPNQVRCRKWTRNKYLN